MDVVSGPLTSRSTTASHAARRFDGAPQTRACRCPFRLAGPARLAPRGGLGAAILTAAAMGVAPMADAAPATATPADAGPASANGSVSTNPAVAHARTARQRLLGLVLAAAMLGFLRLGNVCGRSGGFAGR